MLSIESALFKNILGVVEDATTEFSDEDLTVVFIDPEEIAVEKEVEVEMVEEEFDQQLTSPVRVEQRPETPEGSPFIIVDGDVKEEDSVPLWKRPGPEGEAAARSAAVEHMKWQDEVLKKKMAAIEEAEAVEALKEEEAMDDAKEGRVQYPYVEVERVQGTYFSLDISSEQWEELESLPRRQLPRYLWQIIAGWEMQPIHDELLYWISEDILKDLLTIDAPYETFRLFSIDDLVRNHWSNVRLRPLIQKVCDRMESIRRPCCRNLKKEWEKMVSAK